MRLHRSSWLLLTAGVFALSAAADETADLRATLLAQGELIEELRAELERVRADQRRSEDRVLAMEDQLQAPPVSAAAESRSSEPAVTRNWVDQRIEEFQTSDESRLFLSGYGKAEYRNEIDGAPSTFDLLFNPIFHFRMTDRLHFNAELEFELEDGATHLELEFATIDYLINDWLTFSAGKFLTPFNVFGSKIHPPWINKMGSRPTIYDKKGGIIPVIADVGAMLSGGTTLWSEDSKVNYAAFVTNGPILDTTGGIPKLDFENTPDMNTNKTLGGRIGFLPIPDLELGFSGMTGRSVRRWDLLGADLWYMIRGLELRGEWVRLSANPVRWGYYAQAAYALRQLFAQTSGWEDVLGRLEPVVRWGENRGDGANRSQIAFGLNYWLFPSAPLKFTYEINHGEVKKDRVFLQFAYGF